MSYGRRNAIIRGLEDLGYSETGVLGSPHGKLSGIYDGCPQVKYMGYLDRSKIPEILDKKGIHVNTGRGKRLIASHTGGPVAEHGYIVQSRSSMRRMEKLGMDIVSVDVYDLSFDREFSDPYPLPPGLRPADIGYDEKRKPDTISASICVQKHGEGHGTRYETWIAYPGGRTYRVMDTKQAAGTVEGDVPADMETSG